MDKSNKEEFAKLYYSMGEYYEKKVSTNLLMMFFSDLSEFTIEQVKEGARLHRADPNQGSYFPKPPDIIRHLQTGKLCTEEKAELAWAQITYEIRRTGSYGNLVLDDKQALASLKSFSSWKELCSLDVSRLTWAKKEFMSMYSTYENTPLDMLPSSLPGLVELHNHKEKYAELGIQSAGDIMKTLAERIKNKSNI